MNKEYFQELLDRYVKGECSPEERRVVDQWFEDIADHNFVLKPENVDQERKLILDRILAGRKKPTSRQVSMPVALRIAASVCIFLMIGYSIWTIEGQQPTALNEDGPLPPVEGQTEIVNDGSSVQSFFLPDSSYVELAAGGKVAFCRNWDDSLREVTLSGEAFFNVRKNPGKPFLVYSGNVVTRVLGTSFSVLAPAGAESVEVRVKTGKVSVYDKSGNREAVRKYDDGAGVILTPNETVKYFVEDKHWVTGLVENPQPVITENRERDFVFNDTPMSEIIDHVSEHYQIKITEETNTSLNCTFTGDVSKLELHDMLTIICASIGARYEVRGTTIHILGNGCKI